MKQKLAIILLCFLGNHLYPMGEKSNNQKIKTIVHECTSCDKKYTNSSNLKRHLLEKHTLTQKKIARYLMIDSRLKNLTPGEQLSCPCCTKNYEPKKHHNLMKHIFRKHKINPFFCMHAGCSQSFATKVEIKAHKLSHAKQPEIKSGASTPTIPLSDIDEEDVVMAAASSSIPYSLISYGQKEFEEDIAHIMYGPSPLAIEDIKTSLNPFDYPDMNIEPLRISNLHQLNVASDQELELTDRELTNVDMQEMHPDKPKEIWLPEKPKVIAQPGNQLVSQKNCSRSPLKPYGKCSDDFCEVCIIKQSPMLDY